MRGVATILPLTALLFASSASALSIIAPVCVDKDGTVFEYAKEVQPDMFVAYLGDNPVSQTYGQSILLLSCKSATRVNITNVSDYTQEILDKLQGYVDSDTAYTFNDIATEFNDAGNAAIVEDFDKNSCICGDDIEVSE